MSDWIHGWAGTGSGDELGPLQLAWLGDAVWELHQRLRHCSSPGRADVLHRAVVDQVCADAQAEALGSVLSRRLMSMNWTWFAEVGTVPVAAPGVATQRFMEWRQDLRQWLAGCS